MRPLTAMVGALLLWGLPWCATARAAVVVPPFVASDEDLAIFAPEVTRAIVVALERSGIDGAVAVTGRIETVDRDRIRLRATVAGRALAMVGSLERIDTLAAELGSRIAAALPASAHRPAVEERHAASQSRVLVKPAVEKHDRAGAEAQHAGGVAAPETPRPVGAAGRPAEERKSIPPEASKASAPIEASKSMPPVEESPPIAAVVDRKSTAPAEEIKSIAPAVDRIPIASIEVAQPSPPSTAATPLASAAPASAGGDHRAAPLPTTPPAAVPFASTSYAPPPSFSAANRWRRRLPADSGMLGRTLLYGINTPEGCAAGTWSTLAAREVLERRLRILVTVKSTCGFVRREEASSEAQRLNLRTVVMAVFDTLRLEPIPSGGLRPAGRLRVIVLRDGQVALDRALDLTGRPTQVPELSRAAYDLVSGGFGMLGAELQGVLADAR